MAYEYHYLNRGYQLIIGDYRNDPNNGALIENLQITFEVSKSISNKDRTNSATIEIYNLDEDTLALLDKEYIAADFWAGYENVSIKRLFAGEVVEVSTRKQGTDVVTQIRMGAGYSQVTQGVLSQLVSPGRTVKEVYEELRKNVKGINRGVYNGANLNNPVIDGYPIYGNAKSELNKLSQATQTQWQIDGDVLYVSDSGLGWMKDKGQAIVISPDSGLIDLAYKVAAEGYKKKQDPSKVAGIQFQSLINPDLIPGCIIKLEQDDKALDGYYIVNSSRFTGDFRGNAWYVECRCGKKLDS